MGHLSSLRDLKHVEHTEQWRHGKMITLVDERPLPFRFVNKPTEQPICRV